MDSETAERLRTLQMVDLGSARRDHITSSDGRRPKKARLEDIEAARMSNQPGTKAQHLAQKNRQQLNEWNNAFKKIGEGDVENLDDILSGQSHRVQLSASIRAGVAQDNTETLPTASSRGSRPRGRGGGVIGTRARVDAKHIAVKLPPTTFNHAPASTHIPLASMARKSSLDPALSIDNDGHNRPQYQYEKNRDNNKRNPLPAVVKTRRPMGDFSRLLSPPECFLAEARSIIHMRTQEVTPAAAGKNLDLDSDTFRLPLKDPRENNGSLEIDIDRTTPQSITDASTPLHPQKKATTIPTSTTAPNGSPTTQPGKAPVIVSPKLADTASTVDKGGGPTPGITTGERLVLESVNERVCNKMTDQPGEILLDLSSTPPTTDDLIMSPSLVDLEGLDFRQSYTDTVGNTLSQLSYKRLELEELPMDTKSDGKGPAPPDKYQHDIELLCKLMASTSLSEKHRESLEECKAELEAKLQRVQQTPTLTPISPGPSSDSNLKGDGGLSDTQARAIHSPLRRLRLNVEAMPFVPFTPTQVRGRSVSFAAHTDHIFGDHLLPGRRENQSLIQPKETHIFGNHLLPGRRQVSAADIMTFRFAKFWDKIFYSRKKAYFAEGKDSAIPKL
ncbi:hypothetical protein BBP40_004722 [Aspergillus hancockii]|nr:hypothetical protein BBP40_004722 [Aspergillus hancockii]